MKDIRICMKAWCGAGQPAIILHSYYFPESFMQVSLSWHQEDPDIPVHEGHSSAHAVISRLDYCNLLLVGHPLHTIRPLQLIQNAAVQPPQVLPFHHLAVFPPLTSCNYPHRFKTHMVAYTAKIGPASIWPAVTSLCSLWATRITLTTPTIPQGTRKTCTKTFLCPGTQVVKLTSLGWPNIWVTGFRQMKTKGSPPQ